jgi:serine/threonine-protein kinase HipA
MPTTARELQSDPKRGFTGHGVVEQIVILIEQRCALTIRRLSAPAADMEDETEPSM